MSASVAAGATAAAAPLLPSTHVEHKCGGHTTRGSRDAVCCARTSPVRIEERVIDTFTLVDTRRTDTRRCAWQLSEQHPHTSHRPSPENDHVMGRPQRVPCVLSRYVSQCATGCTPWVSSDDSRVVMDMTKWHKTTYTQLPSHLNRWFGLQGKFHIPPPTHTHSSTR